jgi:hypothetical protein
VKLALAAPAATVPETAGDPTCALPLSNTVNVTVPAFTVPAPLVTVADNVTGWLLELKFADALDAAVVVAANWLTVIESEPVLLPVLLSVHVHATDTLLVNGDPVLPDTFTLSTSAKAPPLAVSALVLVQTTGFDPLAPHTQLAVGDPLNVSPPGNVSVTVIVPLDGPFPLLVTVMVMVSFCSFTV